MFAILLLFSVPSISTAEAVESSYLSDSHIKTACWKPMAIHSLRCWLMASLVIRQSRMCSPCYADKMWRKNRPIICNSPHRLIRSVPLLNPLHTLKYTLWAFVLLLFTAAKCQLVPELDLLTLPKYKGQHLEVMRYFHQANELLGTVLNFFLHNLNVTLMWSDADEAWLDISWGWN